MANPKYHSVSLENHIYNARKLKRLTSHKNRLYNALQELLEVVDGFHGILDETHKKVVEKSRKALQEWDDDKKVIN